jgi:hypothetical protein
MDNPDNRYLGAPVDDDGPFEITAGREARPGNWLQLEADTTLLLVRQTRADPTTEQWIDLQIECVGVDDAPPPLDPGRIAGRLSMVALFTVGASQWFVDWVSPWLERPNTFERADRGTGHRVHASELRLLEHPVGERLGGVVRHQPRSVAQQRVGHPRVRRIGASGDRTSRPGPSKLAGHRRPPPRPHAHALRAQRRVATRVDAVGSSRRCPQRSESDGARVNAAGSMTACTESGWRVRDGRDRHMPRRRPDLFIGWGELGRELRGRPSSCSCWTWTSSYTRCPPNRGMLTPGSASFAV